MRNDEKNPSKIVTIIVELLIEVIGFFLSRELFFLMIPVLIVTLVLHESMLALTQAIIMGVGIEGFFEGNVRDRLILLFSLIGISLAELFIMQIQKRLPNSQVKSSTISRNISFSMIGISIMYIIMYARCGSYIIPAELSISIPREFSVLDNFVRVGFCTADYALKPLILWETGSYTGWEVVNLLASMIAKSILFLPFLWAAVFAAWGQLFMKGFSVKRLIYLIPFALLGQFTIGVVLSIVLTTLIVGVFLALSVFFVIYPAYQATISSFAVILYVASGALTYAIGSAFGVQWGANKLNFEVEEGIAVEDRSDKDAIQVVKVEKTGSSNKTCFIVVLIICAVVLPFLCIVTLGVINIVASYLYQSGYLGG